MKKHFLLFVFCLVALTGSTQPPSTKLLVEKKWKIQSDEMSGLGSHTSLPRETELQFNEDNTWQSTQPIQQVTQGKWRLENNGRTLMIETKTGEYKYLLLQLTETELQYRLKKNAATYTYRWLSK